MGIFLLKYQHIRLIVSICIKKVGIVGDKSEVSDKIIMNSL